MTFYSRFRSILVAAAVVVACVAVPYRAASASTIYSFTLTPTSGTIGGTGTITLATPIPASGSFTAQEAAGGGHIDMYDTILTALSITLSNGDTYSLAKENGYSSVGFFNDTLSYLSFNYNTLPSLQIGGSTYGFTSDYSVAGTQGKVTFNPIPVTIAGAPEPSSLILLGTGLLSAVGVGRRRLFGR